MAFDQAGNLYIADSGNYRVRKIALDGAISTFAGTGNSGTGPDGVEATQSAIDPWGLAFDQAGNLFIADYASSRVRKVDTSGMITTVAGNGKGGTLVDGKAAISQPVGEPTGVAVDGQGNLYITQYNTPYLRKVDSSGMITTIAGNGQWGYSGDGGPGRSAAISISIGPAVDANGNVYFADITNNVIRKLTPVQ